MVVAQKSTSEWYKRSTGSAVEIGTIIYLGTYLNGGIKHLFCVLTTWIGTLSFEGGNEEKNGCETSLF